MAKRNEQENREHHYFRVTIIYSDGGTSGNRVFKLKDRAKAERWAERQKKSPVVKRVSIEPFVRKPYEAVRVRIGRKSI
jgi:hypothetical protein